MSIHPQSSPARLLLRGKVVVRSAVDSSARYLAAMWRHIPGVAQLLGLPTKRIRSVKRWVEFQREGLDWTSRPKGPTYELLAEASGVVRRAPRSLEGEPVHEAFRAERYHYLNEVFIARLPRPRIFGPTGLVVTPDRGVLEESTWGSGWLEKDRVFRTLRLPVERCSGSFYSIAAAGSEGYAHWVLDALPRLAGLSLVPRDEVKVIVSDELSSWQQQSLEMLGVHESDVVPLVTRNLEVDILYFPSYVGEPGNPHPWGCRWIRERLVGSSQSAGTRRIYISRRLATRRRVVNEEELLPALNQHGYEIIEAETLSFGEQVKLFSEAAHVVGAHGAGMAGLLFAPHGTKVLELFDPAHLNVMYYSLADALDQEYSYLIERAVTQTSFHHKAGGHDDLIVDPERFARALDRLDVRSS